MASAVWGQRRKTLENKTVSVADTRDTTDAIDSATDQQFNIANIDPTDATNSNQQQPTPTNSNQQQPTATQTAVAPTATAVINSNR